MNFRCSIHQNMKGELLLSVEAAISRDGADQAVLFATDFACADRALGYAPAVANVWKSELGDDRPRTVSGNGSGLHRQ